jgi:WD40 repeat protein
MKHRLIFFAAVILFLTDIQAQKWKATCTYNTDSRIIYDVCLTKNGNAVGIADNTSIKVFSTETAQLLNAFNNGHHKQIMAIDISLDSTLLVSGGKDSMMVIWDLTNAAILNTLDYHQGIITSLKISPDKRYLISGDTDSKVVLYDLMNHSIIKEFTEHSRGVTSLAFSPDGRLAATCGGDGQIAIYDIERACLITSFKGHKSWVRDVAFNREGNKLISCGDDSKTIVWDISHLGNVKALINSNIGSGWILCADFNDDGNVFAQGDFNGNLLIIGELETYKARIGKPVNKISFKPNEGIYLKLVVATRGKGAFFIDAVNIKKKLYIDLFKEKGLT